MTAITDISINPHNTGHASCCNVMGCLEEMARSHSHYNMFTLSMTVVIVITVGILHVASHDHNGCVVLQFMVLYQLADQMSVNTMFFMDNSNYSNDQVYTMPCVLNVPVSLAQLIMKHLKYTAVCFA